MESLLAVDLSNGNRTMISDEKVGTGPAFKDPEGIALDIANNRMLMVDYTNDTLYAIDLPSGDRVIVSQ